MTRCTAGSVTTRSQCAERQRGLELKDVASRLGISPQAVSATVVDKNHSAVVLDALRSAGVPENLLFDPRKCGKEAA